MTVEATLRKAGPFNGNGVTTSFPFAFKVFAAADIGVALEDTDGVQTVLMLDSDYSVSLNADQDNNPGGTITYPLSGDPLSSGEKLHVVGATAYTQTAAITNLGNFQPRIHENAFDRCVILIQQLLEKVNRTLRLPLGDTASAVLPSAANRAGKGLGFDANGNPVAFEVDAVGVAAAVAQAEEAASTATTQAGVATSKAGEASGSATAASGSASIAGAAATTATTARDAALAAGKIYANTTAGLAAVASGEYFYVPSAVATESLILYRDNAGVAEEVKRYPAGVFVTRDHPDYQLAFCSGTRVLMGLRHNGTWDMTPVNGPLKDHAERHGGRRFPAQMVHISGSGQSNGYGASGALTTAQEYDNLRFNQQETSPTVLRKATRVDAEDPTMGTLSAIKQLLLEEDGLAHTMNDFVLVSANNAVPANTIDQLSEGGTSGAYEAAISQVTSGLTLAAGLAKTWASGGQTWTQGEADAGMAEATYKAKLTAYAENYNADAKAATGQTWDAPLITWQVGSNVNKSVAVAQWKAAQEHPLVFLACPAYIFPYVDFQHLTNVGARWLGGYYGLAWKRIVVDRVGWEPLQPVAVQMVGNNLDVYFNKDGLTLDTTIVPAQTNSGFSVENGSGSAQTINSVTILPGNRVRLALASTPAAGWKVKYGHNTATGMSPYTGGAGNLRDTQMWSFKGKSMHNWCVIFDWTV